MRRSEELNSGRSTLAPAHLTQLPPTNPSPRIAAWNSCRSRPTWHFQPPTTRCGGNLQIEVIVEEAP